MPPTAPSDPEPQLPPPSAGPDNPNLQTFDQDRWIRLVELVQSNEQAGLEELYKLFLRGVRFYLCRQLGPQELDDKVHDAFLVVVNASGAVNFANRHASRAISAQSSAARSPPRST